MGNVKSVEDMGAAMLSCPVLFVRSHIERAHDMTQPVLLDMLLWLSLLLGRDEAWYDLEPRDDAVCFCLVDVVDAPVPCMCLCAESHDPHVCKCTQHSNLMPPYFRPATQQTHKAEADLESLAMI